MAERNMFKIEVDRYGFFSGQFRYLEIRPDELVNLILSNPGEFAFILSNHTRAQHMTENRTRVNILCFY